MMNNKMVVTLVVLFATASLWVWLDNSSPVEANRSSRAPVMVVVTQVEQDLIREQLEASGTLHAQESVVITSRISDTVESIHFGSGQTVAAGDLLVTLTHVEQSAKHRAAQASLQEKQREYNRIITLVQEQSLAQLELDKLQTEVEISRALVAQYQAEIDARHIKAPFSGRLGLRQISPGTLLNSNVAITTLDNIDSVKLRFELPERYFNQIKSGDRIEGQVAAYQNQRFTGQVASIDSRIDPVMRTVTVEANIANPEAKLAPGMLMTLQLIHHERQGLVVPEEAVLPLATGHFLYILGDENRIERRQVQVGEAQGGLIEIRQGVKGSESVVIRGLQRVRPGQQVTPMPQENFQHLGLAHATN